MALLILGIVLWYVTHLWKPLAPASRARAAASLGEPVMKGVMALGTLAAIAAMAWGYGDTHTQIWMPPAFLTHVNNTLMVLAAIVYVAGAIPGHIRHWIRHPQLTAVKIWALAHLLVNGHLEAMILFGSLLGWAVIAMIGINRRDGKGPKPAAGTLVGNLINVGVGVLVFGVMTYAHNWLGVWPFPGSAPG